MSIVVPEAQTMPPMPEAGQEPWDAALNNYLQALTTRLTTAESALAALDARLDAVESNQTALEGRILALETTPTKYTGKFSYNGTTSEPPASGQVRMNNSAQSAVTVLWFHYITADGDDLTNVWKSTPPSSAKTVYIQDRDDASKWVEFTSSTPRIDRGTYVEMPVVWSRDSGTPLPTQQVTVIVEATP